MKNKDDLDKYLEKAYNRDPQLRERLAQADQAWDIAFQIYDLRKKMGLNQTELAKLVHTSQANISRIEAADYTGYTLKTLEKVTRALKAKLTIKIIPLEDATTSSVQDLPVV